MKAKSLCLTLAAMIGFGCMALALDDDGRWVPSGTANEVQFMCRGSDADGTAYDQTYGVKFNCSNGAAEFTGAVTVPASTITTTKIATSAVTTAKLYLDLPATYVPCITTAKRLGYCTSVNATTGVCNACN
jgi:hypothetical protein